MSYVLTGCKLRRLVRFSITTLLALASAAVFAGDVSDAVNARLEPLVEMYRDFHAHPELSFEEKRSAAIIAQALRTAGFEVTENVGGHGVVGVLRNGDGPSVLVRGDMDALPVTENTGLPYASKVRVVTESGVETGVMHACGHDVHMTTLVGTAQVLASQKDNWRGTLVAIAQPAEERGAGAREMLADGLFGRFPRPDYNLALHVDPVLPAGQLGYVKGWAMANVDSVDIHVRGIGGHGARPHSARDPIVLAANIIVGLQTLVSRTILATEPAVVTVGSIHAGTKHNIIPEQAHLQLTVRSYSDEVRQQLLEGIKRIAKGEAEAFDIPAELMPQIKIRKEYTPSLYNNPVLVERLLPVLVGQVGRENIQEVSPSMGGEDFARYGRQDPPIPSFMLRLGAVPQDLYARAQAEGVSLPSIHSPYFYPDPHPTISTGVHSLTAMALELLSKP